MITSPKFSKTFKVQQLLYNVELKIQNGEFDEAKTIMIEAEKNNLNVEDMRELSLLFSKIGEDEKAQQIYEQVVGRYDYGFGENIQSSNNGSDKHKSTEEEKTFNSNKKKKPSTVRTTDKQPPAKSKQKMRKHPSLPKMTQKENYKGFK